MKRNLEDYGPLTSEEEETLQRAAGLVRELAGIFERRYALADFPYGDSGDGLLRFTFECVCPEGTWGVFKGLRRWEAEAEGRAR